MKHASFFRTVSVLGVILILSSCKSSKDKKTDEVMVDSSTIKTDNTTGPVSNTTPGPSSVLLVRHKVANYAKWLPKYEDHDSVRLANGIHSYIIARGTEDSNMVLIAMVMDDVDKAKAVAGSEELKNTMKKAGVVGPPMIDFIQAVMNDTTSLTETVRLMGRHKVKDWDKFKSVFDAHKQARTDAGLTDRVISRSIDDKNMVTLVFSVSDIEKAKVFINSQDLKDKMKEADVDGPPDLFFYRIVKKY